MLGPVTRQCLISTGNDSFDKFLGGGLLSSTLNLFERQGPSSRILDIVVSKSIASTTLSKKHALIYVNFNTQLIIESDDLLSSLPSQRKVKSDLLYKDIRDQSATARIKIAWRYSNRGISSPTDSVAGVDQVDFGVSFAKTTEPTDRGPLKIINVTQDQQLDNVLALIRQTLLDIRKSSSSVNIIIKDLIHPFSPLIEQMASFSKVLYALRCLSRLTPNGTIIVTYDSSLCTRYAEMEQQLYNIADCVVSFHSYETDENLLTGYKDIDGSISYVKVPKINSFSFHFQQDLTDWGYRMTKSNRFFVIDELSLPPCEDDEDSAKPKEKTATCNSSKIEITKQIPERAGLLKDLGEMD